MVAFEQAHPADGGHVPSESHALNQAIDTGALATSSPTGREPFGKLRSRQRMSTKHLEVRAPDLNSRKRRKNSSLAMRI